MNCLILGKFSSVGAQGCWGGGQQGALGTGAGLVVRQQDTTVAAGWQAHLPGVRDGPGLSWGRPHPLDSLAASWLGLERGVWWREGKLWLTSPIAFMADMGR